MKQIAQIRKGKPKPQSASEKLENLDNKLRISFEEPNKEMEAKLIQFYDEMNLPLHKFLDGEYIVTKVPVTIPLLGCLDYSIQANRKLPVCRSDGNGEYWQFIRSGLKMLVADGIVKEEHTDPQGVTWKVGERRAVAKHQPVLVHTNKKDEVEEVIPKEKTVLSVLMPYIGYGEVKLVSTSAYDADRLKDQFKFIVEMATKANVDIIQVPVIIEREPVEITKQWGGGAMRDEEWLLTLTIEQEWMNAQLALMGAAWMVQR